MTTFTATEFKLSNKNNIIVGSELVKHNFCIFDREITNDNTIFLHLNKKIETLLLSKLLEELNIPVMSKSGGWATMKGVDNPYRLNQEFTPYVDLTKETTLNKIKEIVYQKDAEFIVVDYDLQKDILYYNEVSSQYLKLFISELEERKQEQEEFNKHIENISKKLNEEERKELAKLIELVRQQQ